MLVEDSSLILVRNFQFHIMSQAGKYLVAPFLSTFEANI